MLTSLRFKNWRSLRDVEINDLTPITVFVGANSSGKTNIFDGLRFMRSALERNWVEAAFLQGGVDNIYTLNTTTGLPIRLEFDTSGLTGTEPIVEDIHFKVIVGITPPIDRGYYGTRPFSEDEPARIFSRRWQILDEDFLPPISIPANEIEDQSLRLIDRKARNVPIMLDFMRQFRPEVFAKLLEDLSWLLEHVSRLQTVADDRETRFSIYEKHLPEIEAPTISGGTARAIAMLTAMHALNAFDPELPGLVAIEEPDTAIHPLLFWKLVEIFRYYVDVDENGVYEGDGTNRRQIFLTTHNPNLLNRFNPREVRVVERNEQGFTTVKPVSEEIAKIWMDKYGLGEAWLTRTLGGVPD